MASVDEETSNLIRQRLLEKKNSVEESGVELAGCRQQQESFLLEYVAFREHGRRYDLLLQQYGEDHVDVKRALQTKRSMELSIRNKFLSLTNRQTRLVNAFVMIYESVKEVQTLVLDRELIRWKRDQQLAGNGHPFNNNNLNVLQEWCEGLADIIWTMRKQVRELEGLKSRFNQNLNPQDSSNTLQQLLESITELLSNLLYGTFIIEKQPPQVMKTNTRFTATARLLVGGALNVHMAAPAVSVSIVSEQQANQLISSQAGLKRMENYNSGDILNNQGTMEYHVATKQVSVTFRNLQLKKIRRTEKRGTESVMDEKFSLLFWTEFTIGELNFQLWTLSLPVVVIVHGNQESQALATVVWDNAFAEWGRKPFYVPDQVTWSQAGNALNTKWTAACGGPLTEDNLYYIACKALRSNFPKDPEGHYNNMMLTWSAFCKEPLPDKNFTFWEWFYRLLLLTSHHMEMIWKEGLVNGFIGKQAAESVLLRQQKGCFLLRFSDSELGGVTIAYVRKNDFQPPSVFNLAPFTAKDLSRKSMAEVVFDIKELKVLYPERSKEVFRQFCSPLPTGREARHGGYIRHNLVVHIEDDYVASPEDNPITHFDAVSVSSAQSPSGVNFDVGDLEGMDEYMNEDVVGLVNINEFNVVSNLGLDFMGDQQVEIQETPENSTNQNLSDLVA